MPTSLTFEDADVMNIYQEEQLMEIGEFI